MRADDFDLDVIDAEDAHREHLVAALTAADLEASIARLPHDLQAAATGVLLQGRTYSDVSQELGIRQPELVRALHRSRAIIVRLNAGPLEGDTQGVTQGVTQGETHGDAGGDTAGNKVGNTAGDAA